MSLGYYLIIAGLILRFLAVRELSKNGEWSNVPKAPTKIITTGFYRFLDNPAYIGSLLVFLGAFLVVPIQHRYLVEMALLAVIYKNRADFEKFLKSQL